MFQKKTNMLTQSDINYPVQTWNISEERLNRKRQKIFLLTVDRNEEKKDDEKSGRRRR